MTDPLRPEYEPLVEQLKYANQSAREWQDKANMLCSELERARAAKASAEAQAEHFLGERDKVMYLRQIDQEVVDRQAVENRDLTDALRVRVEISDAQDQEIVALREQVEVGNAATYKDLWEALGKSPGDDYPTKWQWILDNIVLQREDRDKEIAALKAQIMKMEKDWVR